MLLGISIATTLVSPIDEDDGTLRLDPAAMTALIAHPHFNAAMLAAATAVVEQYRGHWILNRLVNDRGRFVLGLMVLDLHFNEGDGLGFTAGRLREVAGASGVCSPGRITAFLAALRLVGFLRPVAADDRRLRRLAPTERFLDLHRDRLRSLFAALALIDPAGNEAVAALHRPAFIGAFAHDLVAAYRRGLRMSGLVPEIQPTVERDAGLTMLFSLLVAEASERPVSIAALAERFSVSRSHVLTVLREAEQAGLATQAGPRGGYRAGPALAATLRRFFAIMFLTHLHGIDATRSAGALAE
jgi:biotin operon repressor